jgi:hypothetical protein
MALYLAPCNRDEANAFIRQHHRHHGPVVGCVCCVSCCDADRVVGVAIVGRPVARGLQDGWTAEVTRLCVLSEARNAASKLYAACWRACRALGYRRLVTYTLPEEGGASLRGAGWRCIGQTGGGSWSCPSRPRIDKHPLQCKLRWERVEGP